MIDEGALYVRVSTLDQNLDNQLDDLRKYVAQRGRGEPVEYGDRASRAKDSRPANAARHKTVRVVLRTTHQDVMGYQLHPSLSAGLVSC